MIDFSSSDGNDGDSDDNSSDDEDYGGDDGGDSDHSSGPPSPEPSEPWGSLPRDKQSLAAARACIALARHLITDSVWSEIEGGHCGTKVIPLLQTTYTLCRLLEAIAQCNYLPGVENEVKELTDTAR